MHHLAQFMEIQKNFLLKKILNQISKYLCINQSTNEESAILYSKLHKLRIIGLRFFTVFGELGRPDMFLIKFFEYMRLNKPFPVYNHGNHYRDFTYIDDVINLIYPILLNKNKLKKIIVFLMFVLEDQFTLNTFLAC